MKHYIFKYRPPNTYIIKLLIILLLSGFALVVLRFLGISSENTIDSQNIIISESSSSANNSLPVVTDSLSIAPAVNDPTLQTTEYSEDIEELITYFDEVALKAEYGDTTDNGIARRWEQPISVELKGKYTKEDYATLTGHIKSLNQLNCLPEIKLVSSGGNFFINFVPYRKMPDAVPGYVDDNWGFVSLYWDEKCEIKKAYMGVSTDVTNQQQRNHIILEEFTQGLGLLNDSPKYMDSIFQSEWTEIQCLSATDFEIIKMLYSPVITAGIPREKAEARLRKWLAANNKKDSINHRNPLGTRP